MSRVHIALAALPLLAGVVLADENEAFELPVELTRAGETFDGILYPTPVLYDIDKDHSRELVVGDLMGNIWVCEPDAGDRDTAWTKAVKLVGANGKPIKLNNW